jgi:DNA-binding response OmpR family regulator
MFRTLPLNSLAIVIEDDEKLSVIYCQALKAAGYTPHPVRTGRDALRELLIFQPVLVTLDLQLPDASGADILEFIRSEPVLKDTWVVVATAEPALAANLHNSADLVLIKPVSFTQLRDLALRLRRTPD